MRAALIVLLLLLTPVALAVVYVGHVLLEDRAASCGARS